jgi:hypothetical protein
MTLNILAATSKFVKTSKPVCKSCKSSYHMKKMGEQKFPSGKVLVGYHCMNPYCALYESWQTVETREVNS